MTFLDGKYWNQIGYIFCSWKWISSTQSVKIRLGAKSGSNHEPFIEKFKFTLNKVGKTTRSFRYDLNQILCDYTVEVTNRFKELGLIDRVPKNYGQRFITLYRRWCPKPSPRKRNTIYTNSWEKKEKQKEKGQRKAIPSECRVPKNSKKSRNSKERLESLT